MEDLKKLIDLKINVVKLRIKCSIADLHLSKMEDKSITYDELKKIELVISDVLDIIDETNID